MPRNRKKIRQSLRPDKNHNPKGVGGFKKGQPPAHIPRGPIKPNFLTQALISQLNEMDPHDPANRPRFAPIIDKLIAVARHGDLHAMQMIFDQVQGRPRQQVTLSGPDGGAIKIQRIEHVIVRPGDDLIKSSIRVIEHDPAGVVAPAVRNNGSVCPSPEASPIQGSEGRQE